MMRMNRAQLQRRLNDADTPMMELIIGQIIVAAAKVGDANKFEMLLNRTIGKIREEIIFDDEGKPLALIHRPDGTTFELIPLRKSEENIAAPIELEPDDT